MLLSVHCIVPAAFLLHSFAERCIDVGGIFQGPRFNPEPLQTFVCSYYTCIGCLGDFSYLPKTNLCVWFWMDWYLMHCGIAALSQVFVENATDS